MKTKIIQRLIQFTAMLFLIWLAAHEVGKSGYFSLIPFGIVGVIPLVQWWIGKKFPQTAGRCRAFKMLVWVLISLVLLLTALSFINFDVSISRPFSLTLNFTFILLILTYMQQQKLAHQLMDEQKNITAV